MQGKNEEDEFLKTLRMDHQGFEMGRLPEGLEVQAMVEVDGEFPPELVPLAT
jgi:hypothetical protein